MSLHNAPLERLKWPLLLRTVRVVLIVAIVSGWCATVT